MPQGAMTLHLRTMETVHLIMAFNPVPLSATDAAVSDLYTLLYYGPNAGRWQTVLNSTIGDLEKAMKLIPNVNGQFKVMGKQSTDVTREPLPKLYKPLQPNVASTIAHVEAWTTKKQCQREYKAEAEAKASAIQQMINQQSQIPQSASIFQTTLTQPGSMNLLDDDAPYIPQAFNIKREFMQDPTTNIAQYNISESAASTSDLFQTMPESKTNLFYPTQLPSSGAVTSTIPPTIPLVDYNLLSALPGSQSLFPPQAETNNTMPPTIPPVDYTNVDLTQAVVNGETSIALNQSTSTVPPTVPTIDYSLIETLNKLDTATLQSLLNNTTLQSFPPTIPPPDYREPESKKVRLDALDNKASSIRVATPDSPELAVIFCNLNSSQSIDSNENV